MDYRSLQRSPRYRAAVLVVAVVMVIAGAVRPSPPFVVLGLFLLGLTAWQMVDPDPPPLHPSRSEIAAYVAARPVRYLVESGAVVVLLLVGAWYFYRAGTRLDNVGEKIFGGALGLLGVVMLAALVASLVVARRRTSSAEDGET